MEVESEEEEVNVFGHLSFSPPKSGGLFPPGCRFTGSQYLCWESLFIFLNGIRMIIQEAQQWKLFILSVWGRFYLYISIHPSQKYLHFSGQEHYSQCPAVPFQIEFESILRALLCPFLYWNNCGFGGFFRLSLILICNWMKSTQNSSIHPQPLHF